MIWFLLGILIVWPCVVTAQPMQMPPGLVNLRSPINHSDPLAKNMLDWWRVLTQKRGGDTWVSLVQPNSATLTNMTPSSGLGFMPSSMRGAEGEIRGNGTSSYVNAPNGTFIANLTAFTIIIQFRTTTTTRSVIYQEKNTSTQSTFAFTINDSVAGDIVAGLVDDSIAASSPEATVSSNNGRPHYVGLSQSAKNARILYFDGATVATSSTAIGTITVHNRSFFSRTNGTSDWLNGSISEIVLWDRALSPSEMHHFVVSGKLGHPTLLNRPLTAVRTFLTFATQQGSFLPFFTVP